MYLNMMKKGLAIMALFWSVIAVTALLSMEALLFILPIIWFYSFFDTFNSARYNYDQRLQLGLELFGGGFCGLLRVAHK